MILTPWQSQIYFETFQIPAESVVFQNSIFYFTIENKEFKLRYTLLEDSEITKEFVQYCFSKYSVNKITMNGCFSNAPFSLKHKIKRQALDDNILLLSEYEDFEHYLNSLGKKTRQHLR